MKASECPGQAGFASAAWAVGFGLGIVTLLFAANVVAMHYTRGAMQAAAVAGARSGALAGGTAESCHARAEDVLHGENGLLRGPYADSASVACAYADGLMEAVGTASLHWWLDVLLAVSVRVIAHAVLEDPTSAVSTDLPPSSG